MDIYEAIAKRRSIRKYKDKPVPRDLIEKVLGAAIRAPSGSNRQPWHFVVLQGKKKDEVVRAFAEEVARLRKAGVDLGSAAESARIMAQAPVAVFIYDPLWRPEDDHNLGRMGSLVDTQSVGAAIQNLLLAATAEGLGSLWIADVYAAEERINRILGRTDEMVAAVSLGYADQAPAARSRKPLSEVSTWLE